MNDYLALLIVAGAIAAVVLVSRLRIWRRCRCGAHYCTGCGRRQ